MIFLVFIAPIFQILTGTKYCVEITHRGWRVTSNEYDNMHGDFEQLQLHIRYYESIYELLSALSPEYRKKFSDCLVEKLMEVKTQQLVENKKNK